VGNPDKRHAIYPLKRLAELGFELWATSGTASMLEMHGLQVHRVRKVTDDSDPNQADPDVPTATELINSDRVDLIFNTPGGSHSGSPRADGNKIRAAAIAHQVPAITTVQGLEATVEAITALQRDPVGVESLQDWAEAH
jgi:carbamoyl-phosphate synthase large subunit